MKVVGFVKQVDFKPTVKRYADHIILLATSEAELQELVDRLDRVSRKYILLINVAKTKIMASDGIACRMLVMSNWSRWYVSIP